MADRRDDIDAYLAHFRRRVLLDALNEALPAYWQRRATHLAAVGTPDCDEAALACRRHAWLLQTGRLPGITETELVAILNLEPEAA